MVGNIFIHSFIATMELGNLFNIVKVSVLWTCPRFQPVVIGRNRYGLCLNVYCFLAFQHGNMFYCAGVDGLLFFLCQELAVEIGRVYLGFG